MNYTALYTSEGPKVTLRVAIKLWTLGFNKTWSTGANARYYDRIGFYKEIK